MTRREVIDILNATKYLGFSNWGNFGAGDMFIGGDRRDFRKLFEDDAIRIATEQKMASDAAADQIADRIVIAINTALEGVDDPVHRSIEATNLMDAAEAYHRAFAGNAVEWMEMRRRAFEVRKIVFRNLGLRDYSCVEK